MYQIIKIGLFLTLLASCSESNSDSYELNAELKEKALEAKQKALDPDATKKVLASSTTNFQSTPEAVANEIFKAARTGNFSILSQLCDQVGQIDNDAKRLCEVESTPVTAQESFMSYFMTGKVIGAAEIIGNQANVKIKFGSDGNREETLKMIKRKDRWFLSSF